MAASIPRAEDQEKKEGESLNTFYDQVSEGVHHYFHFFGYKFNLHSKWGWGRNQAFPLKGEISIIIKNK